ncbi:MAG: hypothetical protein V1696_00690 [Candidatus Jorgensenbacteria bacterium]
MHSIVLIEKAQQLRRKGMTFREIRERLKACIPKSTLSYWCKNIKTPSSYHKKIERLVKSNLAEGRKIAFAARKERKMKFFSQLTHKNRHLKETFQMGEVKQIVLAVLYFTEGSRTRKGSLMFGNSDPSIVTLFLKLLREVFTLDEKKFRCTIQCRADQEIKTLERFWFSVTKIPQNQFYKTRIDPRSIGRKTEKLDYKGVCRIDYFSADVYNEIKLIGEMLVK